MHERAGNEKMNHLFKVIIMVLFTVFGYSQDKTLLGGDIISGGFGGPVLKISQLNGETGVLFGGHGGWLISHKLLLGGGGYGCLGYLDTDTPQDSLLDFGYGGAYVEYIIASQNLIHLSIGSMFGVGGVGSFSDEEDDSLIEEEGDTFFIVEPSINANVNISRHFRMSAGISYRLTNGLSYNDLSDKDLRNYSGHITAKFGLF